MTKEEAIAYITEWLKDEYALNDKDREVLEMTISALEQQPCEDAVSRDAVLNVINLGWEYREVGAEKIDEIYEKIIALPSVTQKSGCDKGFLSRIGCWFK